MSASLLSKYGRPVPRYTSYPTAPHFHGGIDGETYRRWLAAVPRDQPLSVYGHIPFCDTLCWFCGCHTKIVKRYQPVADYLEVLGQEIELLAAALEGPRRLGHLHFGGGSPTILTPDDVGRLAERLLTRFSPDASFEFAVEIDPREMTRAQIRAWAEAGMNRASMGVQDFNPEVQAAINRVQSLATTARVVDWLRSAGVSGINMDIMFGLPHQTTDHVLRTLDQVVTLAPDRLALFGYAHVPWMKRHQRLIPSDALPGPAARLEQSEAAARHLIQLGYVRIGLDHFARPDDPLAVAARAGDLRRNFQGYSTDAAPTVLGIGASAIGTLAQGYVQNAVPFHDYAEAIGGGRLAVARGVAVSDDDRLRRAVIGALMCDLAVDLGEIARQERLPARSFEPEIAALEGMAQDGIATVDGTRVRVTERGRPFLRAVCAVFDRYLQADQARHSQAV